MAGLNIENATTLYTNYLDGIDRSLNDECPARQLVQKDKPWTGNHLEWRVHVGRSGAVGPNDDGGALQTPNYQNHVAATATRRFTSAKVQLTDGVMATGSGSENVAGDAATIELDGIKLEMKKMEEGMFFRDGTGIVATAKTGTSGTALKVDDARMLWDNVSYDVYSSTTLTEANRRGRVVIGSRANDFNSNGFVDVTLSTTVSGLASGDSLVWKGGANKAISGLAKLITDSGTLQNISATTYPYHTSLVLDAAADRDLTPSLFRQMQQGVYQKSGAMDPSAKWTILSTSSLLMKVDELYESELRLTADSKKGGLAMPEFQSSLGTFRVKAFPDATYGTMYFVDFSQIYRGVQKKLHFRSDTGSPFVTSQVSLIQEASLLEIHEYYIRERTTSGKLTNLTEDNRATAF